MATLMLYFPNVENLSISKSGLVYFNYKSPLFMQNVQRLAVTCPTYPALSPDLVPRALWPKLWQLRVVSPMLSKDDFPLDFKVMAKDMRNRATMMGRDPSKAFIWKQESGIRPFED